MGRSKSKGWANAPKADAPARRRGPAATVASDFVPSDSDNEEDGVEKQSGTISIGGKKTAKSINADFSDDDMGHEVMALSDYEEDEDEEEDEDGDEGDEDEDFDDEDEDALIERALEKGGRTAELAKQAKMIGAKLKLQRKEDEDDEEQEEEQDDRWGANKKRYYDADTTGMEGSDDEEALQEEEEEIVRLEKEKAVRMRASDYGLGEEDEGEEEEEDTMGALTRKKASSKKGGRSSAPVIEAVSKQLGDLSAEERGAALLADAPELLALLQDLTDSLTEVRGRVGPLLSEVRSGGLATIEGVSYLEAKHLLLLQYCTHIVFYILLKAEGRPVKDHPVIGRLVELRAYLEKIRPIDKRLQYQVDRLIKAAQIAAKQERPAGKGGKGAAGAEGMVEEEVVDEGDATRFGPRRDLLLPNKGAAKAGGARGNGGEEGREGVYRPPKINPVSMDGDVDRAELTRNESRLMKEARRKASRSALVQELAEEVAGAPRELRHELPGFDSLAAVKQRQRLEARAAVEEDMMSRVPLSKEEAKKMKQQLRAGMSGKSMLDDFADEVADIVGLSQAGQEEGGKGSRLADLFNRQKVSQKFGAEAPRGAQHGGDEDLPRREPLADRRIKFDAIAARKSVAAAQLDGDDEIPDSEFFGGGGGKRSAGKRPSGEEDDLYRETKAAAADRKKVRVEKFAAPASHPPQADELPEGARGITNEIERNRGLTPHRRKDLKNPRKKHRIKFQDATMRRKGAVQEVRKPAGSSYGGEATGVKSRIVKSRKLG